MFVCDAYAHIPKDEMGKFDPKTRKCILVGYGEVRKGYRLFETDGQRILYSRDVRFNEVEKETRTDVEDGGEGCRVMVDLLHGSDPEDTDDERDEDGAETSPALRRSTRMRQQRRFYWESDNLTIHSEPKSIKEATTCAEKARWEAAMQGEMDSLRDHNIWELVLPPGKRTVGNKWVYKVKTNSDGSIGRYKARQWLRATNGADYNETFCPVVRPGFSWQCQFSKDWSCITWTST